MLLDTVSNAYSIADLGITKFARKKILELKDLQKEVQKSRSDVQRYLNLGWIGVCEMLAERDLGMDNLMDLWQKFHSFLLLLQYFCLKLEKILVLWEKVLYLLLLYLSFSEFPNRLRPPAQQCLGRSGPFWWSSGAFVGCSMKSSVGTGETKASFQRLAVRPGCSRILVTPIHVKVITPLFLPFQKDTKCSSSLRF